MEGREGWESYSGNQNKEWAKGEGKDCWWPCGMVGTRLHVVRLFFLASWPKQQQQREKVTNLKWALKN